MVQGLIVLVCLFFSFETMAVCPPPSQPDGYSGSVSGQIATGYNYSTSLSLLYVYLNTGLYTGFLQVPPLTVNNFTISKTPDTFYATQIRGQPDINSGPYRETLMTELCGNLLTESGYYLLSK